MGVGRTTLGPTTTLLERERELAVLREALEQAGDGVGTLVVLEGPAGIGKTRLLETAVQRAQRMGLLCLRGRGTELECEMPFGVARQVLAPALLDLQTGDEQARGRDLRDDDDLAAGAASVLAERWAQVAGDPAGQAAQVDALYWLVYKLSRHPEGRRPRGALIAVDDAHWSDAATLRVLLRLAAGLDALPIAIVVAVRSGEPGHEGLLARLRGHPGVRVLRPATLSEEAVAAIVRGEFGPRAAPELWRACAAATGGNPFLISELVASLHADGVAPTAQAAEGLAGKVPDTVVRSVVVRLARLPATARALAEAATVVGPDAPLRLGTAAADLTASDAEGAADALVAAGLLRSADPLLFAHPLIADAVAADMPQLARSAAHRRAAEQLAADGASQGRIAAHLLHTAPRGDPWVVSVVESAAAEAMARGEAPGAARLLERALAEPPPAEQRSALLVLLARAEAANGSSRALELLAESRRATDDPRERARTLQAISRLLFSRGDPRAAVEAAERGRRELDPGDPMAARMLASQLAGMFFVPGAWPETERLLDELERGLEAGRWPPEPLLLAQLATGRGVWRGERAERVRPLAEAALAVPPDPGEVFQGDPSIAAALIYVGEYELAERFLARMAEHARRTGSPIYAGMTAVWRATLRHRQGWVGDAAGDAQQALSSDALGWISETGWSASLLALARLELADLEGARAAIAVGMRADHALLPHGFLLHARGELAIAAGDARSALRDFTEAGSHLHEQYALANPAVLAWRTGAVRALLALGDLPRAEEMADAELADARATASPHAVGAALRAAAAASGGDRRIALLHESVEVLAPSGAQLEHIRARCDLGSALRRARQTRAAREHLDLALVLARGRGATAVARRAYEELRLSGARPSLMSGDEAATVLTPGERRVAELAAQDLSNAQIAKRLFVTRRTVEWHLTQTYRKLGIRSRAGLAQALREVGDGASDAIQT